MATFIGTNGADSILGGDENDLIFGGGGNDQLWGGEGADTIVGEGGDDFLYGGKGDSTLVGGAGNDYMVGLEALDTVQLSGNFADYAIFYDLVRSGLKIVDSVSDRDGTDYALNIDLLQFADRTVAYSDYLPVYLAGTSGNDTLVGTAPTNTVYGFEGDDSIVGGTGSNELGGFEGDDTIYGGDGDDRIFGGTKMYASNDVDGNNTIYAGAGNDVIYGGSGNDVISGGEGIDILICTYGVDYWWGYGVFVNLGITKWQDTFGGGIDKISGIENVWGTDFIDVIIGDKGANAFIGGLGDDTLDGGAGADRLYGAEGNDVYYVDNVLDEAYEDPANGADTVNSSINWTLVRNLENLNLTGTRAINGFGNELNNVLTGNSAANSLFGDAGDDTLGGGAGADTLTGDAGGDIFVFDATLGRKNVDMITDFSTADDSIQLAHTVFSAIPAGDLIDAAFQSGNVSTAFSADVRIIFNTASGALLYDADGAGGKAAVQFATIALIGLTGDLSAGDFHIV